MIKLLTKVVQRFVLNKLRLFIIMRHHRSWLLVGFVICLSSLIIGCSKSSASMEPEVILPAPPTKTFNRSEIKYAIDEIGIYTDAFVINDKKYVLAKREWLENEFSSGLAAFQFQFGINNWSSESNDCDKFSSAASFYLKWLNHSSPNRNVNASLAAGEIYYTRDVDGIGHAINLFMLDVNGILTPSFYEPQTRRFVRLSKKEILSVFFWKL